ncbi:unnamed protein product [Echinostoma caproni]|uniref:Cauli_VI domain-containing protein n=1 Tax=Echinostoma caproni TaxID=27848 RepID=A0A183AGH9_9TREM|nr:unnamed protein product [Echinostoma caproni]
MTQNTNPLAVLRAVGPIGRRLIHHVRQDLRFMYDQRSLPLGESIEVPSESEELALKNGAFLQQTTTDSEHGLDTLNCSSHNSTVTDDTSGDSEKKNLDPVDLDGSVALDYVYHINVQQPSGEVGFRGMCSFVGFAYRPMIIEGAGHQVHAEAAEEFNAYVNAVCEQVDRGVACNPVPPGEHDYLKLSTPVTNTQTSEQRLPRKRSAVNTVRQMMASRPEEFNKLVPTTSAPHRLGHEASDEASD